MSAFPRTDAVMGKPRPHIMALCCQLERELQEQAAYAEGLEALADALCTTLESPRHFARVAPRNLVKRIREYIAKRNQMSGSYPLDSESGGDKPLPASTLPEDFEATGHYFHWYPSVWGGLCVRLEDGLYNGHRSVASQPLYTRRSENPKLPDLRPERPAVSTQPEWTKGLDGWPHRPGCERLTTLDSACTCDREMHQALRSKPVTSTSEGK